MSMTQYIQEIQRQLVANYGFDVNQSGCPQNVPDGGYPMMIEGRLDLVVITGGHVWCSNFINEKDGLKNFQETSRWKYTTGKIG